MNIQSDRAMVLRAYREAVMYNPDLLCCLPQYARATVFNDPELAAAAGNKGWHVETFGGGRYTSVAWYANASEANEHCMKLRMSGRWSGMPPRVTAG